MTYVPTPFEKKLNTGIHSIEESDPSICMNKLPTGAECLNQSGSLTVKTSTTECVSLKPMTTQGPSLSHTTNIFIPIQPASTEQNSAAVTQTPNVSSYNFLNKYR